MISCDSTKLSRVEVTNFLAINRAFQNGAGYRGMSRNIHINFRLEFLPFFFLLTWFFFRLVVNFSFSLGREN